MKLRVVRKWVDGNPVFNELPTEIADGMGNLCLKANPFDFYDWRGARKKGEPYAGKYILESEFQADAKQFGFVPEVAEPEAEEVEEKPKRTRKTKTETNKS